MSLWRLRGDQTRLGRIAAGPNVPTMALYNDMKGNGPVQPQHGRPQLAKRKVRDDRLSDVTITRNPWRAIA